MKDKYSILRVKTPKSCSECELFTCNTYLYYQIEEIKCLADNELKECNEYEFRNDRHPQCPLQDTTELLKTLEDLGGHILDNGWNTRKVNSTHQYNKLHKALGGQDD